MAGLHKTDELRKPDMVAVLSRTHLLTDLRGFLLPVFEAISNSIDGIEMLYGDDSKAKGLIEVAFRNHQSPKKVLVTVTDNGIGLTDENFRSFRTPFSGLKLRAKGRGFGRFIAFKVFDNIIYSSVYVESGLEQQRSFKFDIKSDREIIYTDDRPSFLGCGTSVQFSKPHADWHTLIKRLKSDEISEEIGGHFLPYFLFRRLPKITIQFGDNAPQDIAAHFRKLFIQQSAGEFECDIDGKSEKLE